MLVAWGGWSEALGCLSSFGNALHPGTHLPWLLRIPNPRGVPLAAVSLVLPLCSASECGSGSSALGAFPAPWELTQLVLFSPRRWPGGGEI